MVLFHREKAGGFEWMILNSQVKSFIFLLLLCCSLSSSHAQRRGQKIDSSAFKVYTIEGEMIMAGSLPGVTISAKMPTKRQLRRGRKRLAKFTRIRWNVHKVYPYAVKVSNVINQVNAQLEDIEGEDAKKDFLKGYEQSLFGQYEQDLRKMSRSQGKVLVKLVYRQTGTSSFNLIKNYRSGAYAFFWQSIGLIFGINLKSMYDPEEDEMIEMIVQELESGGYNICYKQYNFALK